MALGGIGAGIGNGISLPLELLDAGKGATAKPVTETTGTGSFANVLKDKLQSLNAEQGDAAKATQDMATGNVDDIAQTMIRIEQANISLQMATQVRNKVIEAYQDITRMQM